MVLPTSWQSDATLVAAALDDSPEAFEAWPLSETREPIRVDLEPR